MAKMNYKTLGKVYSQDPDVVETRNAYEDSFKKKRKLKKAPKLPTKQIVGWDAIKTLASKKN